jgi:5,10-methylenetetrahydromethanopterin reductase
MKFGIRFIEFLGSPRELVNYAVLGEQAGFDSVWYPHDTFMHNTWALTTATAEATSRVKIGGVGISPYHANPCEIATYAATLDELSEGRAILGLGFHTRMFVGWTGIDTSDYLNHTRETIDIIRALFRGEVVEYKGQSFQWDDQCYFRFKPYRDQVPIYICPFGQDYLELSGEIGDGSLPMITPPASAKTMVSAIHAGAKNAGRDPSDVAISGCAWLSISENRQAAADKMRNMVAYFGPHLEEHALESVGLSKEAMQPLRELVEQKRYEEAHAAVTDDMLKLGIVGTPKEVITEIEQLAEAGITEIGFGGPLGPDVKEAIRLMGDKVIPYFT